MKQFNQTYAPPGYRAVKTRVGISCNYCAFKDKSCIEIIRIWSCAGNGRPDECDAHYVKLDPDPATVGMGERSFKEWPAQEEICANNVNQ